ncbi:hypothetical protein PENSPDRAFT_657320 [Peniophora sp. CONT]|nr:hypothetical protein PENSPDRAFT_657320 [Peniophora sp. CONT]
MSHTTQNNRAQSDAFARFNDWDADLSGSGSRTPSDAGPKVSGTVKPNGATFRSSNIADGTDTSRAQRQAPSGGVIASGGGDELRTSGFDRRGAGSSFGVESGSARGESSWGVGRSHATGASMVPEGVQKILPESIERAVPDSIHDTSSQSSK